MIAAGQTVTLRSLYRGHRQQVTGTLRLEDGVWFLDTGHELLTLVREGCEAAIEREIVTTEAERAEARRLAIVAIAADVERNHVLGSVLCGVARTRGMMNGYVHAHGETRFVERLESMGLVQCVNKARGLAREWRLTETGREVVAALIERNALCVRSLRIESVVSWAWRNEIAAVKGAA